MLEGPHVLGKFKGRDLSTTPLTTAELNKWRNALLPKRNADDDDPDETMRKAKATANKYQAYFWAALELAYSERSHRQRIRMADDQAVRKKSRRRASSTRPPSRCKR
jgi:hypothetical protein